MTEKIGSRKSSACPAFLFYLLIAGEFFYMASPFAIYFYSIYGPGLKFIDRSPVLSWLGSTFLPHLVVSTRSPFINLLPLIGIVLASGGFLAFILGVSQIYYAKLTRKGVVKQGIYRIIRHPQYLSLIISGFGLLLLWPRFISLCMYVMMLFVYRFLARAEEAECLVKYGQPFTDYLSHTGRFWPRLGHHKNDSGKRLHPQWQRRLLTLGLFIGCEAGAILLAFALQQWALSSLYGTFSKQQADVAITRIKPVVIDELYEIAKADPQVRQRLSKAPSGKHRRSLNYILPASWMVAEIPMNWVRGANDGHFHPKTVVDGPLRIVFTSANLRTGSQATARQILLAVTERVPLFEVVIDRQRRQVIEICEPTSTWMYQHVPVPVW
jgi:protein-S-isoprenylcysteine O-methyltransferase Ste14